MSATDEELRFANDGGMDHVTYILIMFRFGYPHLTVSGFRSYSHLTALLSLSIPSS